MKDKDILTAQIDCKRYEKDHEFTKGIAKVLISQGFRVEWRHSVNGEHDWQEFLKILLVGQQGKHMTFREIMLGTD